MEINLKILPGYSFLKSSFLKSSTDCKSFKIHTHKTWICCPPNLYNVNLAK